MANFVVQQDFLESSQYYKEFILDSEKAYGRNFCLTGGAEEILQMLQYAEPFQPRRILDVGSGLGGPAFLMTRRYEAPVDGIDVSRPMLELAQERLKEEGLEGKVRFFQGNILTFEPEVKYDLIFSSSVFLHIPEKSRLLDRLWHLLTEGGILLFGDYCMGKDSPEMQTYINQFRYHIMRMEEWLQLLDSRGFQKIAAQNCTARFAEYTRSHLQIEGISDLLRDQFAKRLKRIEGGQHHWCVFCYRR